MTGFVVQGHMNDNVLLADFTGLNIRGKRVDV